MSSQLKLHVLFTKQAIEATVSKPTSEPKKHYQDKSSLLTDILKGSYMFMAGFILPLDFPNGKEGFGKVRVVQRLTSNFRTSFACHY